MDSIRDKRAIREDRVAHLIVTIQAESREWSRNQKVTPTLLWSELLDGE
jgi:hypothetical protein